MDLHQHPDVRQRGKDFEVFVTDLFTLFDMEPRLAYELEREQIDGSLTFDTDDYIVEARWRNEPVSRADADAFAAKVHRSRAPRAITARRGACDHSTTSSGSYTTPSWPARSPRASA